MTDASSGNRATVADGKLKVDTGLSAFGVVPVAPVAPQIYPTGDIVHSDDGSGNDVIAPDSCPAAFCRILIQPPARRAAVVLVEDGLLWT